MLRLVAICAVALGCHLIIAADSDIIDDDNRKNVTFADDFTTILPESEPTAELKEWNKTDIVDDDYPKNVTFEEEFTTVNPEKETSNETEEQDQTDFIHDDFPKSETVVEKFEAVQQERQQRYEIEDEDPKEEKFCSQPPDIDGIISPILKSEKHPLGTIISYQCKFGYVSRSSGTLLSICRMHRQSGKAEWTHPNTTCIPRSCGDPGYVVNARRIGNLFTFPNSVKFECFDGYKLQGLKERYCQASGEWSGRLPTCVPIYCPVPANPINGRVRYSSLDYGSELEYECDRGFIIQNNQPRICNEDGIWSNDQPECIETTCAIPEVTEDVSVQLSETPPKVGTLAFYSCSGDGTLVGASTSKCLNSGDWTFDPPKCLRSCYVPEIQDGELGRNQWTYRNRQKFVSLREGQSVKHHELVTLRCKDGYSPRNSRNGKDKEVECNDGEWSEPLHCRQMICNGHPPPVENASPVINSREHGSSIWYRCDPGYAKKRTGNVTCQYGKWEGPTPACGDYRCYMNQLNYPGLIKPQRSFIEHGEHFNVVCEKAYKAPSWKMLVSCLNGKWDITPNPCIIKTCEEDPPSIVNGQPREFERVNGSIVNYECEDGYELVGHSTVHCAFGIWDGNSPFCQSSTRNPETTTEKHLENDRVGATALKKISVQKECFCTFDYRRDILAAYLGNSEIDSHQQIRKGEIVSFQCRSDNMDIVWTSGLRFFQRMNLKCDRCHDWQIQDLPWCEQFIPGDSFIEYDMNNPLTILPGGIIEVPRSERISFACINGWRRPQWYYAPHTKRINFQSTYDHQINHYREYIIINRMENEHIGKYECSAKDQNVYVRSTILDLKMAELDVTCGELSTETDQGIFKITYSNNRKVHSTAHYSCKDPFKKIVGSSERVCQENGKWSHNFPTCEDITCSEFGTYNGLSVTYTKGTKVGSIAQFTCSNHANLIGTPAIRCLYNGTWSHPKPSCEILEIHCPEIDGKGIFTFKYTNNRTVNSTAQFFCKAPNKTVAGCNFFTCQKNGEWSGDYPTCVELDATCRELSTETNKGRFEITYSNNQKVHSIAQYRCKDPLQKIVGSSERVCQENGRWSHSLPRCEDYISCDLFDTSPNLTVHYTDGGRVGSTAFFECLHDSTLVGNQSAVCLSSGRWSYPLPRCAPPNCSIEILIDSLPENLYIHLENYTYEYVVPGSELPLICGDNLVLTGRSKAACNFHGKWEFADAQCITACRVIKEEASQLVVKPEKDYYHLGEFIILSCPPGLNLTSEVQKMMCMGQRWSDKLPDCTELPEPNLRSITRTTRKI